MDHLYKKTMFLILFMTSVQLQTGHKKFVYPLKKETEGVKGILKTPSRFVASDRVGKVNFRNIQIFTPSQYEVEENDSQEWQTSEEEDQAREEIANLTDAAEDDRRWQAVGERNEFILKATKYDSLYKQYKKLERNIIHNQDCRQNKCLYDSDSSS